MAPVAKINRVDLMECKEVNGVIVLLRKQARVVNVNLTSHLALFQSLHEAGLPQSGSEPETPASGSEVFGRLRLVERNPTVVAGDPATVDVELVYKSVLDGPNQDLNTGDTLTGIVYGRVTASIRQKKANKFYPNGGFGLLQGISPTTIVVGHKFPKDDDDFPNLYKEQGGEVPLNFIQRVFRPEGFMNTDAPDIIANELICTVNENAWMNGEPRSWLCSDVQWELMGFNHETQKNRYRFKFEFQHDQDTWDETAIFIDNRTHRPPPGLKLVDTPIGADPDYPTRELKAGVMVIDYLREVDFDRAFGVFFES